MENINKKIDVDNTDKKLIISDVINSIINEMNNAVYEYKKSVHYAYSFKDRAEFKGCVEGMEKAIEIVNKYYL